jgi:arsenite methyltransferase
MKLILPAIFFSAGSAFVLSPQGHSSSSLRVVSDLFVDETRASVSKYYGEKLQTSDDLKTNACCTAGSPQKYIQDCINNINPEVVAKYYGCGLCLPQYPLEGTSVLDLGCGAGRDVYIASQLVGPTGKVVGVDMTDEQLEVANKHLDYHAEKFGYSNVEFKKGYLEQLSDLKLEPGSFDVIISNCVINLCTDKEAVLKECLNLLKPGGELYFSDVYANRRVPQVLQDDEVLWGECLSGAVCQRESECVNLSMERLLIAFPSFLNEYVRCTGTILRTWPAKLDFQILDW